MSKRLVSLFALLAMIWAAFPVQAEEEKAPDVMRGDVFQQITDHLQWSAGESGVPMPDDVDGSSAYAESISILLKHDVIQGFPDGTVRTQNELTGEQLSYVLARIVGVPDAQATTFLKETYDLTLNASLSREIVDETIQQVLTSDSEAVELIGQANTKLSEQTSYRAQVDQSNSITVNDDVYGDLRDAVSDMSVRTEMEYHDEDGMHITMEQQGTSAEGPSSVQTEQYIVPDGMYMNIPHPESGELTWFTMGEDLPVSFDQLKQMQEQSLKMNDAFVDRYFFYRYDGTETMDGEDVEKVSFNGNVASVQEMFGVMQQTMSNNQQMAQMIQNMMRSAQTVPEGLSYVGSMWIHEETGLPVRNEMSMTIRFPSESPLPYQSFSTDMTTTYRDYNEVEQVELPEEAENAEEMPQPELNGNGTNPQP